MATSTAPESPPLPKGPHDLSRAEVARSQRSRLRQALIELLAENGWGKLTIGALARRAGVSRATFYEQYSGKEECLLDAYDDFSGRIVTAMLAGLDLDASWEEFIAAMLDGYLGTLEREPAAARAFIVEMDSAGPEARARRRTAAVGFAALIRERHTRIRELDPTLGELPDRVYLGIGLGIRELVHERLEVEAEPRLRDIAPDVITWIAATVQGAAAARG